MKLNPVQDGFMLSGTWHKVVQLFMLTWYSCNEIAL